MTRFLHRGLRSRARRGMTLIEIVVSLVILTGAVLTMGAFVARFSRTVTNATSLSTAGQLATDRLEEIKATTRYGLIDTLYNGVIETAPNGHVGFSRRTYVQRVGGLITDLYDFRIVTVQVTTPSLTDPVAKTTIISAF